MIDIYKKIIEEQKNMNSWQRADYLYEQKNNMIEQEVLDFIKDDMLDDFLVGRFGSDFPDSSGLAYTNAGVVLNAIYSVYKKYPELKVNKLFEQALIKLLNEPIGSFYSALNTIYVQLKFEKEGYAPFKIDEPQVFVALRDTIIKNANILKQDASFRGRLYNNLYGFAEDVNKQIEEQKGIRVL